MNNYLPVSSLCFIANVLGKLVVSKVSSYLNSHDLYNTFQSAYHPGHSPETALLKVVYDLFLSLNKGNISVLALHDFCSAFDTIDHSILVHHLHTDFGFTDAVLHWFSSYLTDRTHYVYLIIVLLLLLYTQVFLRVQFLALCFSPCILSLCLPLLTHTIIHHSFADDLQLYMSASPDRISELLHSMQPCISNVLAWATVNMLKLNDNKTELMLLSSNRTKPLNHSI